MFTIYLIHSSHTDLGYTDTQEKMKAHHAAFIEEALELARTQPGFKWNCESYLCVEDFLRQADTETKLAFVNAVKNGSIGLSGSYLNLTDLIPADVLNQTLDRCKRQWDELGVNVTSAMTADINGYSWGFCDALLSHGVRHLLSQIHIHHGYQPLPYKQWPFWWESPKGERLFVWNGEHYNLGNELGIAGTPWFEYSIHDGLGSSAFAPKEKARLRIEAYVRVLKEQGYPYDFVPVGISSEMTDNAPPSARIPEFVREWNASQDEICLKMCTLDEFFAKAEELGGVIPVYRGDWTDWWADGVASTPAEVLEYRRAARDLSLVRKADPRHAFISEELYDAALSHLMLYGEHTWGYSSSVSEPFHPQVNHLRQWKRLYALRAAEEAGILRGQIQRHFGETAVSVQKELYYCAVNPHDYSVKDMLAIDLEHFYGHHHFVVTDRETGEAVPFQISGYSRGPRLCIWAELAPGQKRTYELTEIKEGPLPSAGRRAAVGIEGVDDLAWHIESKRKNGGCAWDQGMETDAFSLQYTYDKGITSVWDRKHNAELVLKERPYAAFTPVYEVTHRRDGESYTDVRRKMGRNRKAFRTERTGGRLIDVRVLEDGPLYAKSELTYELPGTQTCSIILTAYKRTARIGVDFRLHKDSVWEPENVYLSLPFGGTQIWIDKSGAYLRPRIDQLPGSCIDFYAVQNGIAFIGEQNTLLVTSPDVPLVAMGTLSAHPIRLMGEGAQNADEVYSWVMNNFWETNFNVCLADFYQFHYDLQLLDDTDPEHVFEQARCINEGILQFYRFEGKRKLP